MDAFSARVALVKQYGNDFKILVEKGLTQVSSPSFEQRLSSVFNETDFIDTFLIDAAAF